MTWKEAKKGREFRTSAILSLSFFVIYFLIHWFINMYTGDEVGAFRFDGKEMSGPFTISLCSSLLIFSYGTFVSQAMRHLSIVYPDVFFNAFRIFIIGIIVVQVAGHAEILNATDSSQMPEPISTMIYVASYFILPATFLSLFWLEKYQERAYELAIDRLPDSAKVDSPSHVIIIACTLGSFGISLLKPWIETDYWLIFVLELVLAGFAVLSTYRFYSAHKKENRNED